MDSEAESTAVRRCDGCGYVLTGLPTVGRCPECGLSYDLDAPRNFVARPPFGRLLLMAPAALVPPGFLVGYVTFPQGICLIFLVPLTCLTLSVLIAVRLANWRYSAVALQVAAGSRLPSRDIFVGTRIAIYLLLQLIACWAAYEAYGYLAGCLVDLGILPRGWS